MKVAYRLTALGLAASAAAFALPAMAQDYPPPPDPAYQEDIIVTGHYGRVPDDADSASQTVSYSDLDLGYAADRQELRRRIGLTARYLCDRLGESDSGNSIVPSCREAATRDALRRVGTIEEHWAPRDTAWVHPARWHAPYSDEWAARYRDGY